MITMMIIDYILHQLRQQLKATELIMNWKHGIIAVAALLALCAQALQDETETLDAIEGSVPSAPRDLTPVIISTRFVTLRWREPENTNGDIQNYKVYYKQDGSQRERVVDTLPNRLERVISLLHPSVKYQFRIVAHNARGAGASSPVLLIETQSEADVPGPPRNLQGQAMSSSSVALTWEEPLITNGRVIKYIITCTEGENEGNVHETTATTYEFIDFTPFTEYNFWVQAVNENGPSASTSEITVQTLSAQPSQPPHNITLEAANSTSVIIRWEPPLEGENGVITGYKIRYRRLDKRHWSASITTQGDQRMYQLNGLEKHVVYQIRIGALNVNGTGPWSEPMDIEPYERDLDESKVPNVPTNLKTKAMSDSILVSWSPPKDQSVKVRGYTMGWGKGLPDNHTQKLDSKQRYYFIESLEPLSEYVIALRATNAVGDGTPVYATIRTMERSLPESVSPLLPPVDPKAIVLSASTMVLYWTDSTLSKNQYVTDERYYTVRYTSYHHSSNPRYKYFNTTDLNCMIDDLKPNTQYEFTVKLVKGRRESPWSMVVLNRTQKAQPSSPPRDLTVQSVDDHPTAVMLHWQPPKQPNGPITGYVVLYTTDNTKWDRNWEVEGVIGDQTEIMIKNLQPSTTHYFKIQARNSKGYGPFSSTIPFATPQITRAYTTTPPNTENNTEDVDEETNTTDERLIQAVSERPGLFNIKLPVNDRTKLKKEALWLEVTHVLRGTMTTDAVKKRWQYLRDCFVKARNKVRKYKPSGSAAEIMTSGTQSFRLYQQMNFLSDPLPNVVTQSNVESPTTSAGSSYESNISNTVVPCGPLSGASPTISFDDSLTSPRPPPITSTLGAKKRKLAEDKDADLESALVNVSQEQVMQPDAVDGFLARIGERLRRIPYRERSRLEIKILAMLMEVEDRVTELQ